MSLTFTGGVAMAYVGAVVGLHRLNVRRLRKQAGGFKVFDRLDWEALVGDLRREGSSGLLSALQAGQPIDDERWEAAGYSGGEANWLKTLSRLSKSPGAALDRLESAPLDTAAEVYLREHLFLRERTHLFNLELNVFTSKRRLAEALVRFGEQPALYFARAEASSLLGFHGSVLDDLARAVYFSKQAPFYLQTIVDLPHVAEVRPVLYAQCMQSLKTGAPSRG